ncbi:MAG: serine/threonine-protein kinase [Gemmatales bacterium]|nr:serine/threonine protein kinase [Gemmatales bacterium]MDW7994018.1 serine/threonine-protein kinase [Gemmatales bacterium]
MSLLDKILALFGSKRSKTSLKPTKLKERFVLETRVGQGSMSRVFRAYDRKLGRRVCLKILDKEKTKRFEERFVGLNKPSEGEICISLRHRNVVMTYEYGITTEGEQFLVMELIEGVGLNYLIETNNPQLRGKRIAYLVQAAEGLAYVHSQGYLHRDICPRNMMVTHEGVVKLIDFGLAIPNRPEFLRPGNRTGTANYMAPELIKRQATDLRVDLFALGVTAYETITGKLPWEATQSLQVMLSRINDPPRHPLEVRPDLDPDMVAFLLKAIERDRNKRFQTALEFRDALLALPRKDY